MILCCPNNVVWIAIFAVLWEIAPLSLFPRAILRPSSSDPYGLRQNAPKANAIGNGTSLTRLTSTTCQGRSAGFQWFHLPARKVSMSRVTVLPLYCPCGFWILTHQNLIKPWSFGTGSTTVSTQSKVEMGWKNGRAHRTDRHDQNMQNGRCQVCIRRVIQNLANYQNDILSQNMEVKALQVKMKKVRRGSY